VDRAADYELLSEAIDALDRFYDGDSGTTEVRAILKVVGSAISDRELGARISSAAAQLAQRIRPLTGGESVAPGQQRRARGDR
jgi:hypothetical protein